MKGTVGRIALCRMDPGQWDFAGGNRENDRFDSSLDPVA